MTTIDEVAERREDYRTMISPLIHLVAGSTGAGKTTYARWLNDEARGVLFSIDQWMTALFWIDSPSPIEASWSMEQVAARGTPCVLDLGFTRLKERDEFASLARDAGLPLRLHVLDVPVEERWCRVLARNAEKGETHQLQFAVTREMFDFVETLWEPPTDREMADCDGVRVP